MPRLKNVDVKCERGKHSTANTTCLCLHDKARDIRKMQACEDYKQQKKERRDAGKPKKIKAPQIYV